MELINTCYGIDLLMHSEDVYAHRIELGFNTDRTIAFSLYDIRNGNRDLIGQTIATPDSGLSGSLIDFIRNADLDRVVPLFSPTNEMRAHPVKHLLRFLNEDAAHWCVLIDESTGDVIASSEIPPEKEAFFQFAIEGAHGVKEI